MRSGVVTWRVAGLLLAGVLLRLVFLHFRPPFAGDSLIYADLATNLLHHHTYALTTDGVITPTLIRLPGYTAFLALCFAMFGDGNFLAAVWVQIVVSLADACLLGVLAYRLMGRRAGLAALALGMLCPFTANYSVTALTETWSLFCITLAFLSAERWSVALRQGREWNMWLLPMAGALIYAVFLRPDRSLLAVAVIPAMAWIAFREAGGSLIRRELPVAAVIVALLLPLGLWGVRNWRVFHVFQPLAPKYANDPGEEVAYGFQRWYRTWAIDYESTVLVYWPYDGSTVDFNEVPARAFDDAGQRARTAELFAKYNEETGSTPDVDAGFAELARERIAAHPLRFYVVMPLARLADMWLHPRTELMRMPLDWWKWREHPGKSLFSAMYALLNLAYLGLAIAGLRRWSRLGWSGARALGYAMVAFVLLRSALLMTLDNSEQRYTLECFPVVLLLASFALARSESVEEAPHPNGTRFGGWKG
ncbi:MAG TPA: glycosyltransferase family 39 protein [Acidobacteriaceae bacterium]|jgi:hypothetical protein